MTQIHHRQLPQMIPAAWISPDKLESHHLQNRKQRRSAQFYFYLDMQQDACELAYILFLISL